MSIFANEFLKLLKERDELPMNDPMADGAAMAASLDDGTDPSEFDVDMDPEIGAEDEVAAAMARQNQKIVSTIQNWIDKTEEFLVFLNGEEPTSIQSTLANATPETVMDKMKQSQQTKISRVASDLASFHQSLLGFMAQTKNAKFKGV